MRRILLAFTDKALKPSRLPPSQHLLGILTDGKGMEACKAIYARFAPITPGDSENIQVNADYYEVRVPAAPTAYIECEFHDTVEGAKWIVENTVLIGETIARGICDYFGVKFVEKPKPVEPEKKDVLYRVQIGAYKIKANAEKRQAEAKAAGFTDAFIVTVEQ